LQKQINHTLDHICFSFIITERDTDLFTWLVYASTHKNSNKYII